MAAQSRAHSPGEGQGSTFLVKLPLFANPLASHSGGKALQIGDNRKQPLAGIALRLDGLHLLVVEDETDALDLLIAILETNGAKVTAVRSAAAALATMQNAPPDLLISDIEMPDEDGYSLIKKIRALPSDGVRQLPAIALTAYARTEDRLRALAAGYDAHIGKPMEPLELLT